MVKMYCYSTYTRIDVRLLCHRTYHSRLSVTHEAGAGFSPKILGFRLAKFVTIVFPCGFWRDYYDIFNTSVIMLLAVINYTFYPSNTY